MRIHHITSHPPMLMEHMLLEYENLGRDQLAPAFAKLYEQVTQREKQKAATDRMIQEILDHHQGYMQVALKAIQQHKQETDKTLTPAQFGIDPKDKLTPAAPPKQSVLKQIKHALNQYYTFLNRKVPLVSNMDDWVDKKVRKIMGDIQDVEADHKFGKIKQQLRKAVRWFHNYQKNNPSKSQFVVATLGIIAGLLSAGVTQAWVIPAILIVIRLSLMVLSGVKFSSAVTKVLSTSGLAILAGVGVGAFMNSILTSQAAAAATPDTGSNLDPLSQTDSVRERPGTGSTPSSPAAGEAQPVASTAYIDQLRQLVDPTGEGVGVPIMNQESFADAFRAARQAMGSGNIFIWNGEPYTTNTRAEGQFAGLSDEVKRFLRGSR
jgi:ElaB/YqjD/DUF883 family membrane-anchored ribosome-binding protein